MTENISDLCFKWLLKQQISNQLAIDRAETKPNTSQEEKDNLQTKRKILCHLQYLLRMEDKNDQ